ADLDEEILVQPRAGALRVLVFGVESGPLRANGVGRDAPHVLRGAVEDPKVITVVVSRVARCDAQRLQPDPRRIRVDVRARVREAFGPAGRGLRKRRVVRDVVRDDRVRRPIVVGITPGAGGELPIGQRTGYQVQVGREHTSLGLRGLPGGADLGSGRV